MAVRGWITGSARAAGGSRDYRLWVPSTLAGEKPIPLLMLLHGCTHGAGEMAEISGMNEVAEANQFLIVYPEQSRFANLMKCWNWFEKKHQARDAGEPSILAAIVEQVCCQFPIDAKRVYVAGVSAGGAMAVIAGVTYPDIFAGIGVLAGGEFQAASGVAEGLAVMKHGGPDPVQQGKAAFEAMKRGLGLKKRNRMPVIVFHGNVDDRVHPVNAAQVIAQWSETNACLAADSGKSGFVLTEQVISGSVPQGHAYQRHIYRDQDGKLLLEKWIVEDMGHAWPGAPKAQKYGDPKGPNASTEIWRFFREAESGVATSHSD